MHVECAPDGSHDCSDQCSTSADDAVLIGVSWSQGEWGVVGVGVWSESYPSFGRSVLGCIKAPVPNLAENIKDREPRFGNVSSFLAVEKQSRKIVSSCTKVFMFFRADRETSLTSAHRATAATVLSCSLCFYLFLEIIVMARCS